MKSEVKFTVTSVYKNVKAYVSGAPVSPHCILPQSANIHLSLSCLLPHDQINSMVSLRVGFLWKLPIYSPQVRSACTCLSSSGLLHQPFQFHRSHHNVQSLFYIIVVRFSMAYRPQLLYKLLYSGWALGQLIDLGSLFTVEMNRGMCLLFESMFLCSLDTNL